ncbi:basic proline-rich protein-like [Myiozetetes cayanensis]|uniref:basic proline-rich protein-like n=1 Tax=Myiozetetes cayanensis TaxID=478635 RepID=UPI00215F204D|nr:basic proline-rich protein-like [Myiozetetes cayanensis]
MSLVIAAGPRLGLVPRCAACAAVPGRAAAAAWSASGERRHGRAGSCSGTRPSALGTARPGRHHGLPALQVQAGGEGLAALRRRHVLAEAATPPSAPRAAPAAFTNLCHSPGASLLGRPGWPRGRPTASLQARRPPPREGVPRGAPPGAARGSGTRRESPPAAAGLLCSGHCLLFDRASAGPWPTCGLRAEAPRGGAAPAARLSPRCAPGPPLPVVPLPLPSGFAQEPPPQPGQHHPAPREEVAVATKPRPGRAGAAASSPAEPRAAPSPACFAAAAERPDSPALCARRRPCRSQRRAAITYLF